MEDTYEKGIDAFLTRQAEETWGDGSLVYWLYNHSAKPHKEKWYLEKPNGNKTALGISFTVARASLDALVRNEKARKKRKAGAGDGVNTAS